ncbi:MAG: zinc ABC transporter substrate-binding protein [Lachnospiraceae bacterium]|nr:zinc ABC transporter substrate-binding protein [Lachnospiraceae bacterium]
MKKLLSMLMAAVLAVGSLCACANTEKTDSAREDKLEIVTTIFPEYDWVMNILGDKSENADVTMLLDNGVDLHSYQPTTEDILKISNCDLFIYVGGESDEWVEDALQEATNKDMVVINLMDVLGENIKEEEIVEGMEAEDEEYDEAAEEETAEKEAAEEEVTEENEEAEKHEHEEEEVEYDEHVWLSLRNVAAITTEISQALQAVDSQNAATYKANGEAYINKLNALDGEYQKTVDGASQKTILFGDRFPFRYMVDDYGLNYYAAFVGCSAETEASFETISFLAKKVDELDLKTVLTIEGDNHKIAETIVQNTKDKNQQILTMDSMQATTSEDVANGAAYLSIMEQNLEVLKEALK